MIFEQGHILNYLFLGQGLGIRRQGKDLAAYSPEALTLSVTLARPEG